MRHRSTSRKRAPSSSSSSSSSSYSSSANKVVTHSAPTTASTSPFAFRDHFHSLFSGRSLSSSASSLNLSTLDGIRAILCLWIVIFHTFFYTTAYIPDKNHDDLDNTPVMAFIQYGFLAVDGFFILTGILISLPLFQSEVKEFDAKKRDGSSPPTYPSFEITPFWARRFTRMVPAYFVCLLLFCSLFGSYQQPHSTVRNEGTKWFLETATRKPLSEDYGTDAKCTSWSIYNILMINNAMPFGGCMGTEWSFAVTFHFYLFMPIAWKWCVGRYNCYVKSRSNTKVSDASGDVRPSTYFLRVCHVFFAVSVLCRVLSFFHARSHVIDHPIGMFVFFWWYSSTLMRWNAVIFGVYIAYITAYKEVYFKKLYRYVFQNSYSYLIQSLIYLVSLIVFCTNVAMLLVHNGSIGEYAIHSSLSQLNETHLEQNNIVLSHADRALIDSGTGYFPFGKYPAEYFLQPYFGWNPLKMLENISYFFPQAMYYSTMQMGSFMTSFMFGAPIWLFINYPLHSSSFSVTAFLCRLLSHRLWYPIAVLSMFAYHMHPIIISLMYTYWSLYVDPHWVLSLKLFAFFVVVVLVGTFGSSLILYLTVEAPLDRLLRREEKAVELQKNENANGDTKKSTPSVPLTHRISKYYGILLVIVCICGNLLGYLVILNVPLPDGLDFTFRHPDWVHGAKAEEFRLFNASSVA